jgi:sugar phosphate isomerase/epimerase
MFFASQRRAKSNCRRRDADLFPRHETGGTAQTDRPDPISDDRSEMAANPFFKLIPAASAVAAHFSRGAPVRVAAVTPAGFSIAVQLWSLNEFTLLDAIGLAAAAGAGAVEFFPGHKLGGGHGGAAFGPGLNDRQIAAIRRRLAECGIAGANFGVVEIPADETAARPFFELARKLGLYGLTTESAGSIDVLEKLAAEYDIKVCFHNHPKPTALWNPETVWKLVDGRHGNLGFCADAGHWASSGLDPLDVVKRVAPRIRSFHLKDRALASEWSHDRPFGTGVLDLRGMLDAALACGFSGNVSIEYEHNWLGNLAEIAQCAGWLRACGG